MNGMVSGRMHREQRCKPSARSFLLGNSSSKVGLRIYGPRPGTLLACMLISSSGDTSNIFRAISNSGSSFWPLICSSERENLSKSSVFKSIRIPVPAVTCSIGDASVSFGFGTSGHHSSIGLGFVVPVGETYSIDNMVLTIDMVSSKTNKLLCRGTLGYRLDMGATPERYTHMANQLVREILRVFPPK